MNETVPYPVCISEHPTPEYERHVVTGGPHTQLVHEWRAPEPRASLILLHGIGLHGAPYHTVAPAFCARGINLFMPDLRGHGESGGRRAVLPSPGEIQSDYDRVIAFVRGRSSGAVFLGGESMGGLLAADYASVRPDSIDGLILLCPAFQAHASRFILRGFSKLYRGQINIHSRAHLDPSTRVPGFVEAKLADPLATAAVYPSYLWRIATLGWRWPRAAEAIKMPVQLHLPAKDRIVHTGPSRKVLARMATPLSRKTVVEWPDAYHTMFWDPCAEDVITSMASWLTRERGGHG